MASLPQPPDDPEMKKIIDKLAQFVARNGPEFETMTKNKQKDNPQFGFLFGGLHFNYYQYRVTTEQIIQKQQVQKASNSEYVQGKMQQLKSLEQELQRKTMSVAEQIKQSEANLQAHEKAIAQQQQTDIEAAIVSRRAQRVVAAAHECSIDLLELNSVLTPLRNSCTKDNIQRAKSWVLINITDSATCEFFSAYLIDRIFTTDTAFEARLHLAYLINDIMHHCARKNVESLRRCMENVVIPIFCISSCQASEELKPKLHKLLTIWSQHKYFIPEIIEALENPADSYNRFQEDLITKNEDVVAQVNQAGVNKLQALTAQHQEFSNHLNDELRKLQQQYESEKSAVVLAQKPLQPPPAQPIIQPTVQTPPQSTGQPSAQPLGPNHPNMPSHFGAPQQNSPQGHLTGGQPPPMPDIPPMPKPALLQTPAQPFDLNQPPPRFNTMPPNFNANVPPPMLNMSQPPPRVPRFPPPNLSSEDLIPTAPYFDLPAGLMVPLVKLAEVDYKPLNPKAIRLPPPAPPTDRLVMAVEAFYMPPSHDCPVDAEGWEKLGLFEYYQGKKDAKQRLQEERERQIKEEKRFKETKRSRSRSRSGERDDRDQRRSRSRSSSHSPRHHSPRRSRRSRSNSPDGRRRSLSRSRSRSYSPRRESRIDRRSPTPDDMPVIGMFPPPNVETPLGLENKGAQLLKKMGWGGAGLGASEQGIVDPVKAADVRAASDMYRGIGVDANDPFENFRKNRAGVFIQKLKDREEHLQKTKKDSDSSKNS
ncbi:calcium homeostasis endoplasmic reticulum protein-like [Watersipora subatra]|uniref:calcium homeostasis endoplasmic reticulum protein-like n=1 Tax=Watersipora subatra TaxID=2589382 RepID=UPI00355B8E41